MKRETLSKVCDVTRDTTTAVFAVSAWLASIGICSASGAVWFLSSKTKAGKIGTVAISMIGGTAIAQSLATVVEKSSYDNLDELKHLILEMYDNKHQEKYVDA